MSHQTGIKSTKQLAWKLGLVKKRSKSSSDQASKRLRKTFQPFAYLVIIDFESTCWEDKKYRTQEIIEFPAVLLNTGSGEVEEEFHHYVQPTESPVLSEFCKNLTGITQAQVEEGIPIVNCLKRFGNWLNKLKRTKGIAFGKPTGSHLDNNLCTFVTWSDWDLGVCLQYECRRKQLLKPSELNSWIDLRATYRKFYGRKPEGLNGALKDLGIEFEGREHSGLHDSRNTARLAWRMMCDGCLLNITKALPQAAGARMPLMSAGISKSNGNNQMLDLPVTVIAKPNSSAGLVTKTSTISDRKTEVAKSSETKSENTKFTCIRPPNTVTAPSSSSITISSGHPISVMEPSVFPLAHVQLPSSTTRTISKLQTDLIEAGISNTGPPSTRSNVHLSTGLPQATAGKPQTVVQKNGNSMQTSCLPKYTRSNNSDNHIKIAPSTSSASSEVKISSVLGRPSLGASPLLRSDGSAPNKKYFVAPEKKTEVQNVKEPCIAGAQQFTNINKKASVNNIRNNASSTPANTGVLRTTLNNFNSVSNKSPQDTRAHAGSTQTSPDLFKIPTPPAPGRRSSGLSSKPNGTFKIPTPPSNGRDSLGNITWRSSWSSNQNTSHQNLSGGNISISSDMHRTPPLCECGRRTKRRVVQTPGANQGRAFYCCPLGRGTASTGDLMKKVKSGCKYFKWELSSSGNHGNRSVNTTGNSFFNDTRNSSVNSSCNISKIGNSFNRSVSWNGSYGNSSNYNRNQPSWSLSEQFLEKLPCPKPNTNGNAFKSPDIIAVSPPDYQSPDLLNDSFSTLGQFPLLPPDAFSDPDKL